MVPATKKEVRRYSTKRGLARVHEAAVVAWDASWTTSRYKGKVRTWETIDFRGVLFSHVPRRLRRSALVPVRKLQLVLQPSTNSALTRLCLVFSWSCHLCYSLSGILANLILTRWRNLL